MKRISRKYDTVTKFLRETISDTKRGPRVRMAAAIRLSDIYMQFDAAQERKAIAKERAAARIAEAQQASQAETTTPEPSWPGTPAAGNVELSAKLFLDRLTQEIAENE